MLQQAPTTPALQGDNWLKPWPKPPSDAPALDIYTENACSLAEIALTSSRESRARTSCSVADADTSTGRPALHTRQLGSLS